MSWWLCVPLNWANYSAPVVQVLYFNEFRYVCMYIYVLLSQRKYIMKPIVLRHLTVLWLYDFCNVSVQIAHELNWAIHLDDYETWLKSFPKGQFVAYFAVDKGEWLGVLGQKYKIKKFPFWNVQMRKSKGRGPKI